MPQELRPAALPTFRRALWPEGGGFDGFVLAMAVLAFAALKFWRVPLLSVVLASAAAGMAWFFAGGIF